MRRTINLVLLSLLFIYGCEKENLNLEDFIIEDSILDISDLKIYDLFQSFNFDSESSKKLHADVDNAVIVRSSNNTSVSGHFETQLGTTLTFSAIENKGGIHGQIRFNNEDLDLNMETSCVYVYKNTAIFQGIITSSNSTGGLDIDNRLIFYVIDNGKNANDQIDQYSQNLYSIPPGLEGDNKILYDCEFWMSLVPNLFPLISDVAKKSNQIKIK